MQRPQNNIIISTLLLLINIAIFSCNSSDCENTVVAFNEYAPDQIEYQEELERLMRSNYDELSFWLKKYDRDSSGEYIDVRIAGEHVCAEASIRVANWNKLEGVRQLAGQSYSGAELAGLKFTLEKDSTRSYFLYHDLDRIVD